MNKSQLISAVAEKVNLSKIDVKQVVDVLFEQIEERLQQDDKVVISNFGAFSIAHCAERAGRNPRTGEKVKIAARRSVKFRSSMDIK